MDLEEIGINAGNWVDSAQDRDYWRALVNAALNSGFHKPWSQLGIDKQCVIQLEEEIKNISHECMDLLINSVLKNNNNENNNNNFCNKKCHEEFG